MSANHGQEREQDLPKRIAHLRGARRTVPDVAVTVPQSACFNAGASLTPSPVIATK